MRYIKNESARSQTFVANSIAVIRDGSQPSQWQYVETHSNPADDSSRGLIVDKLLKSDRWINGPDFLYLPEELWPKTDRDDSMLTLDDDPEVKGRFKLVLHPLKGRQK